MSFITYLSKYGSSRALQIWSQAFKQVCSYFSTTASFDLGENPVSERVVEFRKKLRAKVPFDKLEQLSLPPLEDQEAWKPWPENTNPLTGEIGGPTGPEPTRYGDWERKGRVSDF